MKFKFKNNEIDNVYQVGNVITDIYGGIYLIVKSSEGYEVINLIESSVYATGKNLEELQATCDSVTGVFKNTELFIS
ncbi:hypothetical protein [Ligilactobacillus salivarius]|uniref:hypothetical protein n=1 Tax=Ligilactobacillus salivarius TaxID=1624 RepID=UPI0009DA10FF|nr:hypothetical protein [Ligilactobacillus salivarius]OQR18440.1 hypothetical protein B6U39_10890 [Ligilactobacillus salivarius]